MTIARIVFAILCAGQLAFAAKTEPSDEKKSEAFEWASEWGLVQSAVSNDDIRFVALGIEPGDLVRFTYREGSSESSGAEGGHEASAFLATSREHNELLNSIIEARLEQLPVKRIDRIPKEYADSFLNAKPSGIKDAGLARVSNKAQNLVQTVRACLTGYRDRH